MSRLRCGLVAAGILAAALAALRTAEAAEPASEGPPLHYRRIYAPADQMPRWPLPRVPHIPVEPAEFERLVELARASETGAPVAQSARLSQSTYEARLDGDDLLIGQARFEIAQQAPSRTVLPLEPFSLAVRDAIWTAANGQPLAAAVGLQPSGALGVLVEQSGMLQMAWTLRGKRDSSQAMVFELQLPACPTKHLQLDLPSKLVPESDPGVIVGVEKLPSGQRRWQINLGGPTQVRLRLRPEGEAHPQRLALLRQASTYDFSPRGVEVTTQLTLDALHEPLRSLSVRLDPSLRLVSARFGEKDIPWTVTQAQAGGASDVELLLPEPIQGTSRVVHLVALAPLVMGEPWPLPALQAQGVFWAEGTARLLLPAPLTLKELSLTDCRQTKVEPLPAPQTGELLTLQQFAPEAVAEVVLGRQIGRVALRQGMTVDVGAGEIAGRMIASFTVSDADRYTLRAAISPHWIVDTVESIPSGQVSDWTTDVVDGQRELNVRLARSLAPKRPLQLQITGRSRRSALERPLTLKACRMLDFLNLSVQRDLMLVRAVAPYQLQLEGDDKVARLDATTLSRSDLQLLDAQWEGLACEYNSQADPLRISLAEQRAHYSGEIDVKATALADGFSESYTIRCDPESARVERVLVHFSQSREQPLRWMLGSESDEELSTRRLTPQEQAAAGLKTDGETWEVLLRRPRSVPFEIRASRNVPLAEKTPLSLATLPEAVALRCQLTIYTASESEVAIENRRLEAVPVEAASELYPLARAAYRYEPSRDVLVSGDPAIALAPPRTASAPPRAWVWQAQLDARQAPDGMTNYLATYLVHNLGRQRVRIELPPGARQKAVWIDDVRVPHGITSGSGNAFVVALPSDRRFATVSVQYDIAEAPLGFVETRAMPSPRIDLPVIDRQATLWLPPGYRARGGSERHLPRLTWMQRLFGPLGRSASEPAFDPTDAEEWVALVRRGLTEELYGIQAAAELIDEMGRLIAEAQGRTALSWGELLPQAALRLADLHRAEPNQNLPQIVMDRQALRQSGLTPRRTLSGQLRGSHAELAAAALEQANLVVLVHGRTLIVTSDVAAALYREQLAPLQPTPLFQILPGPLARALQSEQHLPSSGPLVSVAQWAGEGHTAEVPWTPAWRASAHLGGWSAYRLRSTGETLPSVRIVRSSAVQMLGWLTFLATATLVYWKLGRRPQVVLPLLASAAIAALLLPEACVPPATGLFLGTLGGVLARLLRRSDELRPPAQSDVSTDFVLQPHALPSLLVAACLALGSGTAFAQTVEEPSAEAAPPPATTHEVFIPVDNQQRPTGGKYQVPETLFQQLSRRAEQITRQPRGWLLTGATYRGRLSLQADLRRLAVDEFKAIYDLRVFARGRTICIPLNASELTLLPGGSKLDGRPIAVRWDAEQRAVEFEVEEPGQYRLSLAMGPVVRTSSTMSGFDLAIPALATSRVELTVPPDGPELKLTSATGAVRYDRARGELQADLGTAERLTVRWPVGDSSGLGPGDAEIEQLLWLRVQPGAVALDARWKVHVLAGRVRQLRLRADSRLRLLPFDEDSLVAKVTTEPGPIQTIVLDLKRPLTEQATIEAKMLLTGVSGVGRLPLPVLSVVGNRTSKRWLAVSIDGALAHEEQPAEGMESLAVPDFAALWGDSRAKPLFAYQLQQPDVAWSLAARPRQPRIEAEEALYLSVAHREAQLYYEAQMHPIMGHQFQHRLTVPPQMVLERVSVRENRSERTVRWARNGTDQVTVFLSGPVTGNHVLRLEGRLPLPANGQFRVPTLELQTAQRRQRTLHLFRRADALVKLGGAPHLTPAEEPLGDLPAGNLGRWVGSYFVNGSLPQTRLAVSYNHAEADATLVTSLQRGAESWQAVVECQLRVKRGLVDRLRLTVPEWWNGPFETTPAADVALVRLPGQEIQQLVIRPTAAIADTYRVRLRAPVLVSASDRLRVPQVTPIGLAGTEHYLVLPTQSDLQQIAWETRGLSRAGLPEGFPQPLLAQEAFASFQVVAEQFEAIPKSVSRALSRPQISLADVGVAWNDDGSYRGVARFDLQPAGLANCLVELPAAAQLVQATVAGLPAVLTPSGENRFRLMLGPQQLPQRIELLYTGKLTAGVPDGKVRLPSPLLLTRNREIPIERTLWTVYAPATAGPAQPVQGQALRGARIELMRLRNAAALLDLDDELAAALAPDHLAAWYRLWAQRLVHAQQDVLHSATADGDRATEDFLEARALVSAHEAVAARLGTTALLSQLRSAEQSSYESADLWQSVVQHGRLPLHLNFPGAVRTVELEYAPPAGDGSRRLLAALALGLTTLGMLWAMRRGVAVDLPWRWPQVLGVLVGIFYWLFLTPAFVGWLIVALSLLAALRSPWREAPPRYEQSTIAQSEGNSWVR